MMLLGLVIKVYLLQLILEQLKNFGTENKSLNEYLLDTMSKKFVFISMGFDSFLLKWLVKLLTLAKKRNIR